jgi:hypothetical protein
MIRLTAATLNRRAKALLSVAVVATCELACSACSTAPETQADDSERRVYRTGSNIPVRHRGANSDVRVLDPTTVERTPVAPAIPAR